MSPVARSWRAGFPAKLGPLDISHQLDGAGKSGQRECNSDALSTDHPLTVHCSAAEPGGRCCAWGLGAVKPSCPPHGPNLVHFRIAGAIQHSSSFASSSLFLCFIPTIAHHPSPASTSSLSPKPVVNPPTLLSPLQSRGCFCEESEKTWSFILRHGFPSCPLVCCLVDAVKP